MVYFRLLRLLPLSPVLLCLLLMLFTVPFESAGARTAMLQIKTNSLAAPGYIKPAFAEQMQRLRPVILSAAARHNRPELSQMSDEEFAAAIALVLYNEHNGWLEDMVPLVRRVTALYQMVQLQANLRGTGNNYSVLPANLRPSVGLEILQQQVPLPGGVEPLTIPLEVRGSAINPADFASDNELLTAITGEIASETLAVEFLAANLERGVYRARYEGVRPTWRVLAAWHNGGIVSTEDIAQNTRTTDYLRRAESYVGVARALVR